MNIASIGRVVSKIFVSETRAAGKQIAKAPIRPAGNAHVATSFSRTPVSDNVQVFNRSQYLRELHARANQLRGRGYTQELKSIEDQIRMFTKAGSAASHNAAPRSATAVRPQQNFDPSVRRFTASSPFDTEATRVIRTR